MMDKKWKVAAWIAVGLSIALIVIPRVFPICGAMETASGQVSHTRCYYTYQAEFLLSLSALLVSASLFFIRGAEGRRLGGLFLALLGALTILLPQSWIIGICSEPDAHCHLTYAWTLAGGIVLIIIGAVLVGLSSRSVPGQVSHQNGEGI